MDVFFSDSIGGVRSRDVCVYIFPIPGYDHHLALSTSLGRPDEQFRH